MDAGDEASDERREGEQDEATAAGDDGHVHELGGHACGIFTAHATGEQAGQQVPEGGGEKPDAHRLAGQAGRGQFGDGAQSDWAEE